MKNIFKDKLFLTMFIIIILVIMVLTVYLFSLKHQKITPSKADDITLLTEVTDYGTFFSINRIINNYYDYKNEQLLDILDPNYIVNNNINTNNISNINNDEFNEHTFYAKKMYTKRINNTTYYFINGQLNKNNDSNSIISDISFLVTINNNSYYLMPVISNDINTYANNYKVVDLEISNNGNNSYSYVKYNDLMVIDYYVNYFYNLMYIDSNKAYNMMENISSLENFSDNLPKYDEILKTNTTNYQVSGNPGKKTYYITKGNTDIIITENGIMDFKVQVNLT